MVQSESHFLLSIQTSVDPSGAGLFDWVGDLSAEKFASARQAQTQANRRVGPGSGAQAIAGCRVAGLVVRP